MKKFNPTQWNQCLAKQDWFAIAETEDVNIMATTFELRNPFPSNV